MRATAGMAAELPRAASSRRIARPPGEAMGITPTRLVRGRDIRPVRSAFPRPVLRSPIRQSRVRLTRCPRARPAASRPRPRIRPVGHRRACPVRRLRGHPAVSLACPALRSTASPFCPGIHPVCHRVGRLRQVWTTRRASGRTMPPGPSRALVSSRTLVLRSRAGMVHTSRPAHAPLPAQNPSPSPWPAHGHGSKPVRGHRAGPARHPTSMPGPCRRRGAMFRPESALFHSQLPRGRCRSQFPRQARGSATRQGRGRARVRTCGRLLTRATRHSYGHAHGRSHVHGRSPSARIVLAGRRLP